MSEETTDPRFWSHGLIESAAPIKAGEVSSADTLYLHASALMFSVSVLDGYRKQAEDSGSHAAAKTIIKCMATMTTEALGWFAEADALEAKP